MSKRERINHYLFLAWSLVDGLLIIKIGIFNIMLFFSKRVIQVQYIPDDAYYYLSLAKNFTNSGIWSIDSGNSIASGFHPLWAYVLVLVNIFTNPSTEGFILEGLLISSALAVGTALLAWRYGVKNKDLIFMLTLSIIISSKNFSLNSVSIVEWSLLILLSCLYWLNFYIYTDRDDILPIFILGLLGNIARSDFGITSLSIFLATYSLRNYHKNLRWLKRSWAGLLGSTTGLIAVVLHNFFFTGNFLQSSAKMKLFWAQFVHTGERGFLLPLKIVGLERDAAPDRIIAIITSIFFYIFFVILCGTIASLIKRKRIQEIYFSICTKDDFFRSKDFILVLSSLLSTIGYLGFYFINGEVQTWYTANLVISVFIILYTIGKVINILDINFNKYLLLLYSSFIFIAVVISTSLLNPFNFQNSGIAPWPHQQFMLAAGEFLAQNPLDGKVGSWNAGIINYYEGGHVINIDGLVNDDIYLYAKRNSLYEYLLTRRITYIIDFRMMITSPAYRQRGGYDDVNFIYSLVPLRVFDKGEFPPWTYLTIYKVRPESTTEH